MITPERAITFECEGQQLVGVVSGPKNGKLGVLVLVGGAQYRAGAHRQFVLLARRLAANGIPAMRFDYRGMGDSAGDKQTFLDSGPDIAAAIAAFQGACPDLERVVLWGLCDGASAALLYWHATADARVAGMVLLNPWVISDEQLAQAEITRAFGRLLKRDFWMKVFRGRLDIAGAASGLARSAASVFSRKKPREVQATFQDRMAAGMEAFGGPVLLVLSGRDLVAAKFLALCDASPRWRALLAHRNIERRCLDDADHTFSDAASREKVAAANIEWIERSFLRAADAKHFAATASGICSLILLQLEG